MRPEVHVFGHIHKAYGDVEMDGVRYVNASICDLAYEPTRNAIIIDVDHR